jgi:pimeloyl-ACP methyl ester carboxylesterase
MLRERRTRDRAHSEATAASLALLEAHPQRIEALVLAGPPGAWMSSITSSGIISLSLA